MTVRGPQEERPDKFPEGDPVEVRPADSRAESQSGLNGPSGSPTSPSGRGPQEERIREIRERVTKAHSLNLDAANSRVLADIEWLLIQLDVLSRRLADAETALRDRDYSPAYQDEYQRLWHREAERAKQLEAALALADTLADAYGRYWRKDDVFYAYLEARAALGGGTPQQ